MYWLADLYSAAIAEGYLYSRTKNAIEKSRIVAKNDPKNAGMTRSSTITSTVHSKTTIRPIFNPSASSAATRTPPADCVLPVAATSADMPPAHKLTAPPKAADTAAAGPPHNQAISTSAAVAVNCHLSTVRIGLLNTQKALKLYWLRAPWVNALRRKILSLAINAASSAAGRDGRDRNSAPRSSRFPCGRAGSARWCRAARTPPLPGATGRDRSCACDARPRRAAGERRTPRFRVPKARAR